MQKTGTSSFKRNSKLKIFVSVKIAPNNNVINIIPLKSKEFSKYRSPNFFDIIKDVIMLERKREAKDEKFTILFGFSVE